LSLPDDWPIAVTATDPDDNVLKRSLDANRLRFRNASRELLATFAMTLRDIRYRSGGRVPKTGFDCSGFVQYVFARTLGVDLPDTSASQFRDGIRVARTELQTGDLVFFHTHGKHVSHVGIYLDHGRFIHSPSTGKHVRIDDLDDQYWAQRYAGAKRPSALNLSS
jgi:cell wall-associated NlpC family hydrolase